MMRKTVAAVVAAGSLLAGALLAGMATATPALAQSRPITLLCSPGSNGGTLVNGVCVLPAAGHLYLHRPRHQVRHQHAEHQRNLPHHGRPSAAADDHLPQHLLQRRDGRLVLLPELLHFRRSRPVHLDGFRRPPPAWRDANRRPPRRHSHGGRDVHVHHQGHRQRRGPGHRTRQHHHLTLTSPDLGHAGRPERTSAPPPRAGPSRSASARAP